ncbi:hypothetical protein Tco_0047727 [Tanacetum coccineum]
MKNLKLSSEVNSSNLQLQSPNEVIRPSFTSSKRPRIGVYSGLPPNHSRPEPDSLLMQKGKRKALEPLLTIGLLPNLEINPQTF